MQLLAFQTFPPLSADTINDKTEAKLKKVSMVSISEIHSLQQVEATRSRESGQAKTYSSRGSFKPVHFSKSSRLDNELSCRLKSHPAERRS